MVSAPQKLSGGRLVLVVGPSGAGKDTLIDRARAVLEPTGRVVFVQRIVTRAASAFEDNQTVSETDFDVALAAGAYALSWRAHGLSYAIPASIDREIAAGRAVVANVSRGIIAAARGRYADVVVVLVTAPPDVLAARLAARARPSDGVIADRLKRAEVVFDDPWQPDIVIDNSGSHDYGARQLIAAIQGAAATVES
ncbi:MAG: phosphonate metabolism protein/1,5-bisphosphokinase (PRPP-forming) PhnN [Labrys sp. (in: a-proteobacteria)]